MSLKMTATNVQQVAPGIWSFEMPPHQIKHFGTTNSAIGPTSVILFKAGTYDVPTRQLHFEAEDATPINLGTTPRVIGLALDSVDAKIAVQPTSVLKESEFGPGDRGFIELARRELPAPMFAVALSLLQNVRQRSPGDLKRGKSRNFSDTPDNFWYVIIQPRIAELSITVRGPVDHFSGISKLEIKDDRGNTRFKVRTQSDIPEALKLIFHAERKL